MALKVQRYILGLDLGIASVGWACVWVDESGNPIGLLDCGVRTFERAEVPKTGDSLAAARRQARSVRRLIRRRAHRLLRLRRLLKREGVLAAADFGADGLPAGMPLEAWALRVAGLDRKLEPKEWAAVLLHMVKHRGYLSQRKSELAETGSKSELGRLLTGVAENSKLLAEKPDLYRTPAELAVKVFAVQNGHMRNKGGDYSHTFNRLEIQSELHLLFERQRAFGNPSASAELEAKVEDLLMTQRSALQGEAVLKMLGKCTFEPSEYKAAKHTYSAERFIWLTKLNNLRIVHHGEERALDDAERRLLLDEPYKKAKLTYAQVRKILGLPESALFKGLRYGNDEESAKKAENSALVELKAYHKIRTVLEKSGLQGEWENRIRNPELLDAIGTAFSLYKTDEDIQTALAAFRLPEKVLDALLKGLNFDKFIELSLPALAKILPLMEQGKRYDEACAEVYGDHRALAENQNKRLLPQIQADDVRNPVVLRTLTQARKVVNAIIRRYGSPYCVHIETARELGKSFQDRKEIEKQQENNRKERERAAESFKELFPHFAGEPKYADILKMRLYYQQHGQCLYSGLPLDLGRLNEKGYAEIDHALPFSRTWDDSLNNKVLVLGSENQKKRNQTPYEYLGGAENSTRWREFQARVQACAFPFGKKQRIQTAKLDSKAEMGFLERNLNDTRYVTKFFVRFVKEHLKLAGADDGVQAADTDENMYWKQSRKQRVFAPSGSITAMLRGLWGLRKVREENDRHHALDAIVVACATVSMQQKITKAMQRREELETVDREMGEVKTRIPQPWDFFRQEVMIRVFSDRPSEELAEKLDARPEAAHEFVSPLFVSRAPNRKMTGQGHEETVKSTKRLPENISVVKKMLMPIKQTDKGLRLQDIQYIAGYPDREPAFYAALMIRLLKFNNEPKKAFANPFYKPSKRVDEIIHKQLVDAWKEYLRQLSQEIENRQKQKKMNQKELDEIINQVAKQIFCNFDDYSDSDKYSKRLDKERKEIDIQPLKSVRMEEVQKTGVPVRKNRQGVAQGIADNATMVRVDVFGKGGKNYLVPVYAWQVAQGVLPNRAVVALKNEDEWEEIDDSFVFKFSLYPNDLVEVVTKKGKWFGYYAAFNRWTAAIDIREHDLDIRKGKDGVYQGVGVKTAFSFQKYQTDPLGKDIRPCKPEQRPELKQRRKK